MSCTPILAMGEPIGPMLKEMTYIVRPEFLQQLAHQFERRPLVPPGLDQHIKNFTLGIHGAPEVDQATIDLEIDFIQMVWGFDLRLRRSAAIIGANPRRRGSSR